MKHMTEKFYCQIVPGDVLIENELGEFGPPRLEFLVVSIVEDKIGLLVHVLSAERLLIYDYVFAETRVWVMTCDS